MLKLNRVKFYYNLASKYSKQRLNNTNTTRTIIILKPIIT